MKAKRKNSLLNQSKKSGKQLFLVFVVFSSLCVASMADHSDEMIITSGDCNGVTDRYYITNASECKRYYEQDVHGHAQHPDNEHGFGYGYGEYEDGSGYGNQQFTAAWYIDNYYSDVTESGSDTIRGCYYTFDPTSDDISTTALVFNDAGSTATAQCDSTHICICTNTPPGTPPNTPPHPVNCSGSYGTCTTVGTGCAQYYTITTEPSNGGTACPAPQRNCNGGTCKVDCLGRYETCGTNCQQNYTVTTPARGSGTACPASSLECIGDDCVPIQCVGSWGSCESNCQQTYTITTPASRGGTCPAVNNSVRSCTGGSCIEDCVGAFSTCASTCTMTFSISTPAANGGQNCDYAPNDEVKCTGGVCSQDTDCYGFYSQCAVDCTQTYEIAVRKTGAGASCNASHGDARNCTDGECGNCVDNWSTCDSTGRNKKLCGISKVFCCDPGQKLQTEPNSSFFRFIKHGDTWKGRYLPPMTQHLLKFSGDVGSPTIGGMVQQNETNGTVESFSYESQSDHTLIFVNNVQHTSDRAFLLNAPMAISGINGPITPTKLFPEDDPTYAKNIGVLKSQLQNQCIECPGGQYQKDYNLLPTCFSCPRNSIAPNSGLKSCAVCGRGKYSNDGISCSSCGAGTRLEKNGDEDSVCVRCPAGKYTNVSSSVVLIYQCLECPKGFYANFGILTGSTTCLRCQPGTYNDQKSQSRCKECERGQYRDNDDHGMHLRVCENCRSGQYQDQKGRSLCFECLPGQYNAHVGRGNCSDCPIGYFTNAEDMPTGRYINCTACKKGRYSSSNGLSFCIDCEAGRWNDQIGVAEKCVDCGVDTFSEAASNEIGCKSCGTGRFASGGATSCSSCPPGKYVNRTNMNQHDSETACAVCGAGRFSSELESDFNRGNISVQVCTSCISGKYQDQVGKSLCLDCLPGQYNDGHTQTTCKRCAVNTFSDVSGRKTSCDACSIGETSVEGSITCVRDPCTTGTYKNDGTGTCVSCPQGWSSETLDATACIRCKLGTFSSIGSSVCLGCDPGTIGNLKNPGSCISCEAGLYQNVKGQSECMQCPVGTAPNNEATACERPPWGTCVLGEYLHDQPIEDNTKWSCEPCPTGADCKKKVPNWSNMQHLEGYWAIPEEWDKAKWGKRGSVPFVKCPFPSRCGRGHRFSNTTNTTGGAHTCLNNSDVSSPACSVCQENHFVSADHSCTPCRQYAASTAENISVLLSVFVFVAILAFIKRKRLKELRRKYANVWRDILRIFTISLSYAQINSSLPMIITVPWPSEYIGFLEKFDFVNFDVMSMLGFGCVSGMDYRFRAVVTCLIPLFVVLISLLSHMCRSKPDENDPEHRRSALIFMFDIIDYDQNGSLDVNEFQTVLQLVGQKDTTVMHALALMTEWNGEPTTELSRDAFLTAASNDKVAKSLGTRWVERAEQKRSRSERLGNLLLVFFLIHAPISQRMFYYFSCQPFGDRFFLRSDYAIECWVPSHESFMPFIFFVLVVFTAGLPLLVLILLCKNRKNLYTPKIQQVLGFLYVRFNKNAEMWEIHEVARKLTLMGILIFLPNMARSAAAILVCVVCCCTLNYFQPHRNRVVLMVAQISFLMSTGKYIVAVLLTSQDATRNKESQQILGWILVLMDILFMAGSIACMVAVFVLLRASIRRAQSASKAKVKRMTLRASQLSSAASSAAKEYEQQDRTHQENNTKVHPVSMKSEELSTEEEVKRIRKQSDIARRSTLTNIKQREAKADARVQKRLALRKKAKQAGALKQCAIFSNMNDTSRNHIVDAMAYEKVENGAILCMQGQPATSMYLLMTGSCIVMVNMLEVAKLRQLDVFGESALFATGDEHDPSRFRTATIIAIGQLELLVLNQKALRALIASGDLDENTVAALGGLAQQRKESNMSLGGLGETSGGTIVLSAPTEIVTEPLASTPAQPAPKMDVVAGTGTAGTVVVAVGDAARGRGRGRGRGGTVGRGGRGGRGRGGTGGRGRGL